MKKSELKKIIKEELTWYRRQLQEKESSKPVVNSEKASGIMLGAVKTLFNSGAIIGVDPSRVTDIANELIKQISVAVAPYGQQPEPESDDLNDEVPYSEEDGTLDDQSQYDPDIQKQTSDEDSPTETDSEPEEPLFEISKIARKLKL